MADHLEPFGSIDERFDRANDGRRAVERDQPEAVRAHEVDVAALLSGDVVVYDDRKLGGIRLGERSRAGLGDEEVDGAKVLGNLVGKTEDVHRRRQRTGELFEAGFERFVAAADDDELDGKLGLCKSERRRQELPAPFAACHQHDDRRLFARQIEVLAQAGLASGDVVELRMDRMAEQMQTPRRHGARERALIDFAGRYDDGIDIRNEPRLVNLAEIGDDGDDRHVLHVRVVARAHRGVVEQRMNRNDDVGLVTDEEVAQTLAVERLAEAHQRAVAPASVGGVVERAVDRRSVAQGHAIPESELRQREGAMRRDVLDPRFERLVGAGLFQGGHNRVRGAAVTAARVRDQQKRPFGHRTPD